MDFTEFIVGFIGRAIFYTLVMSAWSLGLILITSFIAFLFGSDFVEFARWMASGLVYIVPICACVVAFIGKINAMVNGR